VNHSRSSELVVPETGYRGWPGDSGR